MRIGLIGFGTIARELLARLPGTLDGAAPVVAAVLSERTLERRGGGKPADGLEATFGTARELLAWGPELVIECAAHAGVEAHVPPCLRHGVDVIVVSVGALADGDLHARLEQEARRGGGRMILPAGAIGGLDLLGALGQAGLESVRYRSVKPPAAWRGSPAEDLLDLDAVDSPATFFEGDARGAARDFPKNANVAATLALHGLGFERTEVRLVADPGASGNTHEIEARGASGEFSLRVTGRPSAGNARTSLTTVLSVLHEIGRWRESSCGA